MSHEDTIQVGDEIKHEIPRANFTVDAEWGTVISVIQPSRACSTTRLVVVIEVGEREGQTVILDEIYNNITNVTAETA